MLPQYDGVQTRLLSRNESRFRSCAAGVPLVIAPGKGNSIAQLRETLAAHSSEIVQDVTTFGAVLLRGFDVRTEAEFESAMLSLRPLRPMADSFMNADRSIVDSTRFVVQTSLTVKTGGTLAFGGFHNENYNNVDVPRFIAFSCLRAPWLGGETGLVHTGRVYRSLDKTLTDKLESRAFQSRMWTVSGVEKRYGVSRQTIAEVCSRAGMPIVSQGEQELILMCKPSVFEFPASGDRALALSWANDIPGIRRVLWQQFQKDYSGLKWLPLRLARQYPILEGLSTVTSLKQAIKMIRQMREASRKQEKREPTSPAPSSGPPRIGSIFNRQDVEQIAAALREHFFAFTWKRGDILLLDNLQVAHAGLPGFGPRLLRVMMFNPIPMQYAPDAPGRQPCPSHETPCTVLAEQLEAASEQTLQEVS